mmetsp:Transcript_70937/g.125407  ORF Transcript_70937/g.125407 Transcript_70937/m.125407 type:complete len:220 (+) Transcript_70937:185-844(+)
MLASGRATHRCAATHFLACALRRKLRGTSLADSGDAWQRKSAGKKPSRPRPDASERIASRAAESALPSTRVSALSLASCDTCFSATPRPLKIDATLDALRRCGTSLAKYLILTFFRSPFPGDMSCAQLSTRSVRVNFEEFAKLSTSSKRPKQASPCSIWLRKCVSSSAKDAAGCKSSSMRVFFCIWNSSSVMFWSCSGKDFKKTLSTASSISSAERTDP